MTIAYTAMARFPQLDDGGGNWGAVNNGVLEDIDAGLWLFAEAGESISQHDIMCLKTDGKWYKAKADSLTTMACLAIAPAAISFGDNGRGLRFGWYQKTGWTWSPLKMLYLSSTSGVLTQTKPTTRILKVGIAITATLIMLNPDIEAETIIVCSGGEVVCNKGEIVTTKG